MRISTLRRTASAGKWNEPSTRLYDRNRRSSCDGSPSTCTPPASSGVTGVAPPAAGFAVTGKSRLTARPCCCSVTVSRIVPTKSRAAFASCVINSRKRAAWASASAVTWKRRIATAADDGAVRSAVAASKNATSSFSRALSASRRSIWLPSAATVERSITAALPAPGATARASAMRNAAFASTSRATSWRCASRCSHGTPPLPTHSPATNARHANDAGNPTRHGHGTWRRTVTRGAATAADGRRRRRVRGRTRVAPSGSIRAAPEPASGPSSRGARTTGSCTGPPAPRRP